MKRALKSREKATHVKDKHKGTTMFLHSKVSQYVVLF